MPNGGPYLQLATFCDQVITDKDDVLSLIRVIDRVTQQTAGPNPPTEMPPVKLNLVLVISLKPGSSRGRDAILVRPEAPSGQQLEGHDLPVHFEGGNRGINLILRIELTAEMEGLYWFDVILRSQDKLLTRVPLEILYQPIRTGT